METASEQNKKQSVPVLPWMRNPIDVSLFDECPINLLPFLDPRLEVALQNMAITSLFPVQVAVWQETIGPGSFERDLCINSPTGSGKTLAYALPIVQMLSTRVVRCLRALVVLPTRDLALQPSLLNSKVSYKKAVPNKYDKVSSKKASVDLTVLFGREIFPTFAISLSDALIINGIGKFHVKEVFGAIAPAVGLTVGLAVGQSSIADEISELIKRPKLEAGLCYDPEAMPLDLQSSVDILVATPGRLMDHINSTKGFTLEHLCYLVVDETDRLLREAYQSWLPTVLQLTRSGAGSFFPHASTFLPSIFDSLKTTRRSGVERGFKGKTYPRLVKMVLSATLTRDPSKFAQLDLHHPLFLTSGQRRYRLPEQLESFKLLYLGAVSLAVRRSRSLCISVHTLLHFVVPTQTPDVLEQIGTENIRVVPFLVPVPAIDSETASSVGIPLHDGLTVYKRGK
ncbi:DEAD-box ATP-dependent RNA helicase 1 [Sarracenia purpurea var. burkii]